MVAYKRDEIISITDLARNLSTTLNSIIDYSKDKLAISKNNKIEAVIIPVDEYERMVEAYEEIENMEIAKIIEERSQTGKENYIALEEFAQKRGINLDEL